MNVWIYDENSYPSGFAGGFVPGADARVARPRPGLREEQAAAASWATTCVARLPPDGRRLSRTSPRRPAPASAAARASTWSPRVQRAGNSPWHGGRATSICCIPGVTREVPRDHAGGLPPRDRRPVRQARARLVHRRAATSARPAACPGPTTCPSSSRSAGATACSTTCPAWSRPVGDWKQVRHDYFQVLLELFIERWAKPYHDYCEKHGLEFTGHYWEHEWPNCVGVPDNMAMYAWHQRPGDRLPDEPVPRGHPRPVRQRPDGQGAVERGQPARPPADAVRGLRRRRLGPAVRGHEADRRLALRAGRQHARPAPLLRHASAAPASATTRSRSPTTSRGGRRTT